MDLPSENGVSHKYEASAVGAQKDTADPEATLFLWGSAPGIGAGRHRGSWTQKNRRRKKTQRPERKKPLLGGAERRRNRSRQKPLKTAADPGELCERAATLQEKRGLSRYGVRYKGKQAGGGRYGNG
ncbi:hypothetical protein NDU88_004323 [Pleurodeles waltl]|uniref:Uncharacterized protein n=1 Tax=Pleurodeles waltl TaxID=8319 RepID=A0AAV7RKN1_PLEWA|nr:hypothetical protein NDU88_004323 [Pleurodeles waltl]